MSQPTYLLDNPFEIATRGNFAKAHRMAQGTDAKLFGKTADPTILAIYNILHPQVGTFDGTFIAWNNQKGAQKGTTVSVNSLLDETSSKLDTWQYAIEAVYPEGSANWVVLFPQGRNPFQHGTKDARIAAFHTLDNATPLAAPALAATKTDVNNFYTALVAANNTQSTSKGNTETDSSNVEAGRITITTALYACFGSLIAKFAATPDVIDNYMDLSEMGHTAQTHFVGSHLKPLSIHNIVQRMLAASTNLKLINNGNGDLTFYLSAYANGAVGTTFITIGAHSNEAHPISQLGDATTMHFLNVYNPNTAIEGSWELEIM